VSPAAVERRFEIAVAVLGVAFAISLALFIVTYSNQQSENGRITALANARRADSNRIAASQTHLIDTVDQMSCQRTIVTRLGLVTFFDAAAAARLVAERQESDPRARALDAALVKADHLAAHQERSAGCNGTFPDGGSG
jgi:C4-dicarboxylate-specific signal transduction histidine kinase